jgi:hypothetical protein
VEEAIAVDRMPASRVLGDGRDGALPGHESGTHAAQR